MDKWMKVVLVGLIGTYLLFVIGVDYGSSTVDNTYKIRNEQLEQEKESLTLEIQEKDHMIEGFLMEEKEIEQATEFNKVERTLIKEEMYETINDIDSSDNDKLYRFFANFKTKGVND